MRHNFLLDTHLGFLFLLLQSEREALYLHQLGFLLSALTESFLYEPWAYYFFFLWTNLRIITQTHKITTGKSVRLRNWKSSGSRSVFILYYYTKSSNTIYQTSRRRSHTRKSSVRPIFFFLKSCRTSKKTRNQPIKYSTDAPIRYCFCKVGSSENDWNIALQTIINPAKVIKNTLHAVGESIFFPIQLKSIWYPCIFAKTKCNKNKEMDHVTNWGILI